MNCRRCRTNTEDIYPIVHRLIKDKDYSLCKECIGKIVIERRKYGEQYIALLQNTRKQAEKTEYKFSEYKKQIQDLEELVKFMQIH